MAKVISINVVLNAELEKRVKKEAKQNQRSMSGEIRQILTEYFAQLELEPLNRKVRNMLS